MISDSEFISYIISGITWISGFAMANPLQAFVFTVILCTGALGKLINFALSAVLLGIGGIVLFVFIWLMTMVQ